jgi:PIN domain nuclease of toxin-antitoxin system
MLKTSEPSNRLILLDTHVWLWAVQGSGELSTTTRDAINEAARNGRATISAISIWEIALLAARHRIALGQPINEWVEQALLRSHVIVEPLSPAIAIESGLLPEDFRSDPADNIIMATARVIAATLLTRDRRILAYAARRHLTAERI